MGDDANYSLTTSEELDNLQPGDNTIVVTAALVRLDPPRRRQNAQVPRVQVLRAILSNMVDRELRVLFWEDRIPEFEGKIYRQVLRITRPRVVLANPAYADPGQTLMRIELSIQKNTSVEVLGPIPIEPIGQEVLHREVMLRDVGNMLGHVRISAYIRYKIERQVVLNYTYGSGAITDGYYHLCVNVTGVDEHQSPNPGTPVVIIGELRRNNFDTLILQVSDMSAIRRIDDLVLSAAELRNGFRVPPRAVQAIGDQPVLEHQQIPIIHPSHGQIVQNVNAQVNIPPRIQTDEAPSKVANAQANLPSRIQNDEARGQALTASVNLPPRAQVEQAPRQDVIASVNPPPRIPNDEALHTPINLQSEVQIDKARGQVLNAPVIFPPRGQIEEAPAQALVTAVNHIIPNIQVEQSVGPSGRIPVSRAESVSELRSIIIEDSDDDETGEVDARKRARYTSSEFGISDGA